MATKLKDLKITKVDFVDKGANPKANIMSCVIGCFRVTATIPAKIRTRYWHGP